MALAISYVLLFNIAPYLKQFQHLVPICHLKTLEWGNIPWNRNNLVILLFVCVTCNLLLANIVGAIFLMKLTWRNYLRYQGFTTAIMP